MKKVFIINAGQVFADSGGKFNATLAEWTAGYFESKGAEVKFTNINDSYIPDEEAQKYAWADFVVYHIPVWWFQVPFEFKKYIDLVFEIAGEGIMFKDDGRSRKNANSKLHYGTGGLLQGTKYMITTTWNAPLEAFTVEGEIFYGNTPDDVLFGVHAMNKFVGIDKLKSIDFYDVVKDISDEKMTVYQKEYIAHLSSL